MRTGIVIAGGHSRRFGTTDKAIAELDSVPLVRRVAEQVVKVVDELVVNCRREQVCPIASALDSCAIFPRFAIETSPGRGPVAGLLEGLRSASASEAVVTACDMPHLDPAFLNSLFADAKGATGAVPIFEGHTQPLCAVYRVPSAIEACQVAFTADDFRLAGVVERLEPILIPENKVRERTRAATFQNVNTQADLAVAEAQLRNIRADNCI